MLLKSLPVTLLGALLTAGSADGEEPPALSLESIFTDQAFDTADVPPVHWPGDAGHRYTTLEEAAPADEEADTPATYRVLLCDPGSGEREILAEPADLTPAGEDEPLAIDALELAPDGQSLIIYTNSEKVWRKKSRGDYYHLDLATKALTQLGGASAAAEGSALWHAEVSPDSNRVAYVYDRDLYTQSLDDFSVTRLTHDGSDDVTNGTFDWVYEEEFGLQRGFAWSPDSSRIAYWQIDDSRVGRFTLVDTTGGEGGLYPQLKSFPYPKAGTTNPAARVFVVPATGGDPEKIMLPGDPRDHYVTRVYWNGEGEDATLVIRQLDRAQDKARVFLSDPARGDVDFVFLFQDSAETWFDDRADTVWLPGDEPAFLWLTEHEGWRTVLRVQAEPGTPYIRDTPAWTAGDRFDVIDIAGFDEGSQTLYFTASPDNPTQRYLYSVGLDGDRPPVRISPGDQAGSHHYDLSPDAQFAVHRYSSARQPTVTSIVRLPEHATIETLEDNADLAAKIVEADCPSPEFLRVPVGDGITLDAWMIKPPDFDPQRRYPTVIYVYGEPAGTTVVDRWGGKTALWHRFLAQRGFVVVSVDNRGTPSPRGTAFRHAADHQIGVLAPADQAAAISSLAVTHPFIDRDRIGIWGHSGGGSMTLHAMFQFPGHYRAGIAIAFIADQRLYDTIYQERYMGLPSENDENYTAGSPITHAHRLAGELLLIYGTGDDNTHYQNCDALVDRLVEHGKQFSLIAYPNRTHSLREGENSERHRFDAMTEFFERTLELASGPR